MADSALEGLSPATTPLAGTELIYGTQGGDSVRMTVDEVNAAGLLDEDDFVSNSATKAPSQQSAKAYVDAKSQLMAAQLLHIREEQASGTGGGAFTSGSWQLRGLNTVKTNEIAGASLSAGLITLPAGTYYVEAEAVGYKIGVHKLALRNADTSADIIVGSTEYAGTSVEMQSESRLSGRFVLASETDVGIYHRCGTTQAAGVGRGQAASFGVAEVYADLCIWRVD